MFLTLEKGASPIAQFYGYSNRFKEYFKENSTLFEQTLLSEAVNVKDKIDEIMRVGNIDLVNNAHTLVMYIINGEDESLKKFAEQEGIAWATHSIDLSFKLEWVHSIRRTLWLFIEKYYKESEFEQMKDFFELETEINNRVDDFLNTFFIRYSVYKDSLIKSQQQLVENLSVQIIPINDSIFVLPLVGTMDTKRAEILQEKVLTKVSELRIATLILDLSGVAVMDRESIIELKKSIDGLNMMGCKTVITGLRKEIVREVMSAGLTFNYQTETLATLQQALSKYFLPQMD
ncbi:Anti-anti-sigma regulatory factor (antagonist of anti-sigma factor) [Halobacillus alkaliphilus]|uniref:Anti-anti-sigma regulatory factor (Antagonist of anti-sigma factor) n=1 Tax=Halobacillus alkaliphilus TaxID=396056 RepID=A0A1I2KBH5_9BACI|nr:Anti-anti-sigma regulatory factor (antagonist of anti-sigma factor) [Halobacillus alkaliphilus]